MTGDLLDVVERKDRELAVAYRALAEAIRRLGEGCPGCDTTDLAAFLAAPMTAPRPWELEAHEEARAEWRAAQDAKAPKTSGARRR